MNSQTLTNLNDLLKTTPDPETDVTTKLLNKMGFHSLTVVLLLTLDMLYTICKNHLMNAGLGADDFIQYLSSFMCFREFRERLD